MRREWGRRAAIYAALPPDKKEAFLDQQLAEMQRMMAAMRAAAQQAGQQANAGNPQGGGQGRGPNQPNANRGNQGRVAGQGRMDGAKRFLDSSTPAERAQGQIYMQALQQRAAQNGTPMPFGGRGGGGGFF